MKINNLCASIQAILFAAGEPLEIEKISEALQINSDKIQLELNNLNEYLMFTNSGICLVQMENKYQLCTKTQYAAEVRSVLEIKKNTPLSSAAFEVLAVVAYNQPVTKAFIEQVRGVDCSGVIQTLIAKSLIEECGRLELPGRPLLYSTTPEFLKCFCISSLEDLPELPKRDDLPDKPDTANQINFDI